MDWLWFVIGLGVGAGTGIGGAYTLLLLWEAWDERKWRKYRRDRGWS
jgi:hypothetical protein